MDMFFFIFVFSTLTVIDLIQVHYLVLYLATFQPIMVPSAALLMLATMSALSGRRKSVDPSKVWIWRKGSGTKWTPRLT